MTIAEKLTTIAENEQKVYDAGYDAGYADGEAQGSGDNYYDAFWDALQINGARFDYEYAFFKENGTDETFRPKYYTTTHSSMKCGNMFNGCKITNSEHLKKWDFSKNNNFIQTFYNSTIEELGVIDMSSMLKGFGATNMCLDCKQLRKIEKIIPPRQGNFNNSFKGCTKLEEVTFEGEIISDALNFGDSPLNKASIKSIIGALSPNTSGLTVTLSRTAVDNAYMQGSPESGDFTLGGATQEWALDVDFRSNWTISLI